MSKKATAGILTGAALTALGVNQLVQHQGDMPRAVDREHTAQVNQQTDDTRSPQDIREAFTNGTAQGGSVQAGIDAVNDGQKVHNLTNKAIWDVINFSSAGDYNAAISSGEPMTVTAPGQSIKTLPTTDGSGSKVVVFTDEQGNKAIFKNPKSVKGRYILTESSSAGFLLADGTAQKPGENEELLKAAQEAAKQSKVAENQVDRGAGTHL